MTKNILFTTLFKKNLKYFDEFIYSVNIQKSKDFLLIILINEKMNNIPNLKKKIKVPFKIIKHYGNPIKSRILSIKKLSILKPNLIIFIDSDDIMKNNRISEIIKNIKAYDFIVHNMQVFFNEKKKKFLNYKTKNITLKDINDCNFIGFSNLAIKYSILKNFLNYKKKLKKIKALDWYLIKKVLIENYKGIFLSKILSLYRVKKNNIFINNIIYKKEIDRDLKIVINNLKLFSSKKDKIKINTKINTLLKKYKYKKFIYRNYNYKGWYSYL